MRRGILPFGVIDGPVHQFFTRVSPHHFPNYLLYTNMRISRFIGVVVAGLACAFPAQLEVKSLGERADASLVGYLGVFFLGSEPNVYFYLSNGNNAISFKALNKGAKILDPTSGTGGVRDPSIIAGAGSEAGKKWYIIGTDLDIAKVCGLSEFA